MSKNQVTIDEKNFNRLKKTLHKNLNKNNIEISSSKLSEVLSHSLGFSNYYQAKKEDFKTDKFKNKAIYQPLDRIFFKDIQNFIFNQRELAKLFLNVSHSAVLKTLGEAYFAIQQRIVFNLARYLEIEQKTGVKFNLSEWIDYFKQIDLISYFVKLTEDQKDKEIKKTEINLINQYLDIEAIFNFLVYNSFDPINRLDNETILCFQKKLLNYVLKANNEKEEILYLSIFKYTCNKKLYEVLNSTLDIIVKATSEEQFKRCFNYIITRYPFFYNENTLSKDQLMLRLIFNKKMNYSFNVIDFGQKDFVEQVLFNFRDEEIFNLISLFIDNKIKIPKELNIWSKIITSNKECDFGEKYRIFEEKINESRGE